MGCIKQLVRQFQKWCLGSIGVVMKYLKQAVVGIVSLVLSSLVFAEAPLNVDGAETVGLEQAHQLYEDGAVFIDVRDSLDWALGHIDGAVHLDFSTNEFSVLYVSEDLDRETPVVFYTSSPLNIRSAMATFFAANWGYKKVYYFRDGFYSWMAADYPVNLKYSEHAAL